jgi:hypothetical protein
VVVGFVELRRKSLYRGGKGEAKRIRRRSEGEKTREKRAESRRERLKNNWKSMLYE